MVLSRSGTTLYTGEMQQVRHILVDRRTAADQAYLCTGKMQQIGHNSVGRRDAANQA